MRRGVPEPSRDSSMRCRCGEMLLWRAWINGKVMWYWCPTCDRVDDGKPPKKRKRLSK